METDSVSQYKEFLLVLAVAGIVVPLLVRMGLNSILGFLLVGIVLSPSVLGAQTQFLPFLKAFVISDAQGLTSLGELGVVFLLFLIGLELSFERLVVLKRLVFGLGGLQVLITLLILSGLGRAFGLGAEQALIAGAALSLSSTAIVIQLYAETKRMASQPGRVSFAVLLMQDLAVIPLLLLIGTLGGAGHSSLALSIAKALLQAGLAVGAIVAIGRFALRPLLRMVAGTQSSDLFMAIVLFIAVGAGAIASYLGLSMALGAFIAGLTLAETEYRRAIEATLEPFKGILLGAFFLLVGMSLDLSLLAERPFFILALTVSIITLKAAILYGLARLFRITRAASIETALMLAACGEFAFVILAAGKAAGIITLDEHGVMSMIVIISMLALPALAWLARKLARQANGKVAPTVMPVPTADAKPQVIIAGFGRVGQLLAAMLAEHKVPYIAVDSDAANVANAYKQGLPVFFGDASNAVFLRTCGIDSARVIAVTMDNAAGVDAVVTTVRHEWKDIKIIARARDERHAMRLYEEGVSDAVPETVEASLQLGESILVEAGIAMGLAIASVHERRDASRKLLGRPNRKEELATMRRKLSRNLKNPSQA